MRTVTAVVFDLDGTLVDSAPDLRAALNRLLATLGRRPLALDEVARIVGDGARVLVERALDLTGGTAATDDAADLTRRFLADYEANAAIETRPYPFVAEVLRELRASGLALGVCTNKPVRATRRILAAFDLDREFVGIVGGDSLPGIRKPDPRHVEALLVLLRARPDAAVMVGDSGNDVAAARAAGLPVIVRAGGYGPMAAEALGADAIIESFVELPATIARMSAAVS